VTNYELMIAVNMSRPHMKHFVEQAAPVNASIKVTVYKKR